MVLINRLRNFLFLCLHSDFVYLSNYTYICCILHRKILKNKMASPAAINALPAPRSSAELCEPILQSTTEQLLLEVKRETEESGRISEDLMSALLFVFQTPLHQAFDLLDQRAVTRYSCPAGRELYRVRGSGGRVYTCLTSSNYCSCPSFVYTVLVKEDSLLCKHMLAVQLSRAIAAGKRGGEGIRAADGMGSAAMEELSVTNEEFGRLLLSATLCDEEGRGNPEP